MSIGFKKLFIEFVNLIFHIILNTTINYRIIVQDSTIHNYKRFSSFITFTY